jgi:hypothetical protein
MKSSIVMIASGLFLSLPLLNANAQSSAAPADTVQVVHPAAVTPKKIFTGTVTIVVSLTVHSGGNAGHLFRVRFCLRYELYELAQCRRHGKGGGRQSQYHPQTSL